MLRPAKQPFRRGEHDPPSQQPTVMIGEGVFSLTIPPGDIHLLFQLLLPTIHTRTPPRCGCSPSCAFARVKSKVAGREGDPGVTPRNPRVTPRNPRVTPRNPRVTPRNPRVSWHARRRFLAIVSPKNARAPTPRRLQEPRRSGVVPMGRPWVGLRQG